MATRWHPGGHPAAVWTDGLALFDGSVAWRDAERIWTSMSRESSLGTFLELLAATSGRGLLALPPFAVALFEGNHCHLAVRGHFLVEARSGEAGHTYTSEGITTWLELQLAAPEVLILRSADDVDGEGLPVREGLILAGSLSVGLPVPASAAAPSPSPDPGPPPAPDAEPAPEPVPESAAPAEPAEASEPVAAQAAPEAVAVAESRQAARLLETAIPVGVQEPAPPPAAAPAGLAGGGRYASLLAESIVVRPEDAAIRPETPETGRSPAGGDSADGARAGSTHAGAANDDLHDGHTILAADEPLIAFELPAAPAVPMVLACFCARGHVNPPQRPECRVCRSPVDPRTERTPRPALGRLRTSSGEVVDLVGRIIAGRSPSQGKHADPAVRLVPLPHAHVSGNHLEITLEGWTVLARDLNSTNGTYLHRRDQPVVRLPESAIPLADGDVLDLGHGVSLSLEQLP